MKSPGILSLVSKNRTFALELALVVLAAALGVNLISTFLGEVLPGWMSLVLGVVLIFASIGFLVWLRLKPMSFERKIRGFFLYDKGENQLVKVENYKLSEETSELLAAGFAEDAAFKKQWDLSPLSEAYDPDADLDKVGIKSKKLMQELLEYMVLERLNVHLSDFFNSSEFSDSEMKKYNRNDVPQVLLANRFLELFSRSPEHRAAFMDDADDKVNDGWTLINKTSASGAYFYRFELRLPKDSSLSRSPSGDILIDGPIMSVCISVPFNGYGVNVPFEFIKYYVGRRDNLIDVRPLLVELNVEVRVKRQLTADKTAIKYSEWVEDFLEKLEEEYSQEAFLSRIGWSQLEAYLKIRNLR